MNTETEKAHTARLKAVRKEIKNLSAKLDKYEKRHSKSVSWGNVGDIAHIETELKQITDWLK